VRFGAAPPVGVQTKAFPAAFEFGGRTNHATAATLGVLAVLRRSRR
jgi:hypothetical protein